MKTLSIEQNETDSSGWNVKESRQYPWMYPRLVFLVRVLWLISVDVVMDIQSRTRWLGDYERLE